MRHAANADRGTDPMRAPPPGWLYAMFPSGITCPVPARPALVRAAVLEALRPVLACGGRGGAGSKAAFPRCAALPAGRCPCRGAAAVAGAGPAKRRGCGV
ncbi:MAG: hypothetical protein ACLVHY_02650 [Gemmiger sp.]